jgi:phospholipid/cholesterol/gamma-HCH transport system substrate-binding protein
MIGPALRRHAGQVMAPIVRPLADRATILRPLASRAAQHRRAMVAGAVIVTLAAAGLGGYAAFGTGPGSYTITAQFTQAPGLYTANSVNVLGVPTGKITSVSPASGQVNVAITLPSTVKIPAGARAVLMAPNPVSDRSVELTPPYTGGPALSPGDVIPLSHTAVPLEVDQVMRSVDSLANTLGPSGANSNGSLSAALHSLAQLANGNGGNMHAAVESIAAAMPALTAHPDELKNFITSLDRITQTLAEHNTTINQLYGDLSGATGELASDRQTLASAITNLQTGLAQVTSFIRANQSNLGGSIHNLAATLGAIDKQQQALENTFGTAPLGFQNFNNAVDRHALCPDGTHRCVAAFGRIDLPANPDQLVRAYCGRSELESLLPLLAAGVDPHAASAVDSVCIAGYGTAQGHPGPPGSPPPPDLGLSTYLGQK